MDRDDAEEKVMARMSRGDFPAALEEADLALRSNPRDEHALRLRASLRVLADDWKAAIADLTALLAITPSARLRGMLANAYRASGDLAAALAEYDRELSLEPGDADLHVYRARVRRAKGDVAGAREDLTAAALQGGAAAVWTELAELEAEAGDDEGALRLLDKAAKAEPGWHSSLNRGVLKAKLRRWDEAMTDLDSAVLELADRNDGWAYLQQAYLYRGWCRFFLGKEDPIEDLDEAVRLGPDDAQAFTLRGGVRAARGDAQGFQDLDEAIRLEPGNALAFSFRGDLHLKLGDKQAAQREYRKAISLDPKFEETLRERLERAQVDG